MKILITGNMGYIGPIVARHLRKQYQSAIIVGFDVGYFAGCLMDLEDFPERILTEQHFGDIRRIDPGILDGVDVVVHLAAISNDPMGKAFESVTEEINHRASIQLAMLAVEHGVKSFVFASSCSVYGSAGDEARSESAPVNPLTAYARSKVATEIDLKGLAGASFKVSCLRFSTACGFSPRLRLDLVLNDFVASALSTDKILILSDGTPWRPLIDVRDMARAIDWAIARSPQQGGDYLVVNVGADSANYQVRELAVAVQNELPGVQIEINKDGQPDKRSYKVNFGLFSRLAAEHQPRCTLADSVKALVDGLTAVSFSDSHFRESHFIRLNSLRNLKNLSRIDSDLFLL